MPNLSLPPRAPRPLRPQPLPPIPKLLSPLWDDEPRDVVRLILRTDRPIRSDE